MGNIFASKPADHYYTLFEKYEALQERMRADQKRIGHLEEIENVKTAELLRLKGRLHIRGVIESADERCRANLFAKNSGWNKGKEPERSERFVHYLKNNAEDFKTNIASFAEQFLAKEENPFLSGTEKEQEEMVRSSALHVYKRCSNTAAHNSDADYIEIEETVFSWKDIVFIHAAAKSYGLTNVQIRKT